MGPYRQGRIPPTPFEPPVCEGGCLGRKLWGIVRLSRQGGKQVGKFVWWIVRPWWTFLRMMFALIIHGLPVIIPVGIVIGGIGWFCSMVEDARVRRIDQEYQNRQALELEACQVSCYDMGAKTTHLTRYGCFCHNEETDERFRLDPIR